MHRRYDRINIPIELLRTVVAIAELGSFTKAGEVLQLTQSAISAQIKRLQQLVGGELFAKTGPGLRLNELGESVASYARRILALNDQILSLRGTPKDSTVRVGLPNGLTRTVVVDLIRKLAPEKCGCNIYFSTGNVEGLARALHAGHLDVAFLSDSQDSLPATIIEWVEQLHWIKSPNFVLSPGSPVPLVSWPGGLSDRHAIRAFEQRGIQFLNVFVSSEIGLRMAAVGAGLGLMCCPLRSISKSVIVANDHYLPPLPAVRAGIYAREGVDQRRVGVIASLIETVVRAHSDAHKEEAETAPVRSHRSA